MIPTLGYKRAISERAIASAERRRCPECHKANALITPKWDATRTCRCRYCGYVPKVLAVAMPVAHA